MATLTVNPTIDGTVIFNDGGGDGWATDRSATTGTGVDTTLASDNAYARFSASAITRLYLEFDISSLGAGATVTAVSLHVWADQTAASSTLGVTQYTPDTEGAIVVGDYDSITLNSPTEYATRLSTDPAYGEHEFVFNASGITYVDGKKASSVVALCLREGHDIDDNATGSTLYRYFIRMNDYGTAAERPKLVVTYTSAPVIKTMNTVAKANIATINTVS